MKDKTQVLHSIQVATSVLEQMKAAVENGMSETVLTAALTPTLSQEERAKQNADAELAEKLVNVLRSDVSPLHLRITGSEAAGVSLSCVWPRQLAEAGGE